jgi:hypothetical protein
MDRVPEKCPNTTSRLIAMAVALVGDVAPVVAAMKCSDADFQEYCAGRKDPESPEYERLIELVVREQGKVIAKNRASVASLAAKRDKL